MARAPASWCAYRRSLGLEHDTCRRYAREMRAGALWAVVFLGCSNGGTVVDVDEPDGGKPSPAIDASTDAGRETDADAGETKPEPDVDAGPAFGRSCTVSEEPTECESLGSTVETVCYWDQGKMYGRCTFECWERSKAGIVVPSPGKAQRCEALGGLCAKLRDDGFYVCVAP